LTILRRALAYANKVFGLRGLLDGVRDERQSPRIPASVVVRSAFVMLFSRLGSLNALELTRPSGFWRRWINAELPSADTMGRVFSGVDLQSIRDVAKAVYGRLKRNKAVQAPAHGLMALVIDAHESHCSFRSRCAGCLKRTIKTKNGAKTQYYHRNVTAMLVARGFVLLIDAEEMQPGEDEVATALRLLERVFESYPRAFDVVTGDALYADSRLFNFVVDRGKDVLAVLKANQRGVLEDASGILKEVVPTVEESRRSRREWWDAEGFDFPNLDRRVRVVRSCETKTVRRQLSGEAEDCEADWYWVTTLPAATASTATIVELGHRRWAIENEGFNQTVNRWHADHVYRHDPTAVLGFWLLCMIAFNVFQAFFFKNLKPEYRAAVSQVHVAQLISAELYVCLPGNRGPP